MSIKRKRLIIRYILGVAIVATAVFHHILPATAATTILAYTSFEEPTLGSQYSDTGNPNTGHPLTNNSGQSPVNYSGGGELGFSATYINTRNSTGLTDGDNVGVTDLATSYPDGTQSYQMSDTDGQMIVTLDTVDLSSVVDPQVTLSYFLQQTSWESDDTIRIWVEVDGSTEIDLLNSSGQDIDDMNIEDSWLTLNADLSSATTATLKFSLDSNSGLETLFIDAIEFSGTVNNQPGLSTSQSVTTEPLLGDQIQYTVNLLNTGSTPVADKGYNLTITDTLPLGLTYLSADPTPTFVEEQADGTTLILWDNIADLDAQETLDLQITAVLSPGLTTADSFTNQISAAFNDVPDNSGTWLRHSNSRHASPQSIDIDAKGHQSTGDEQASGAGEYDGNADWPYSYELTIRNNNVASTDQVIATAVLPPGVAYLGNPQISPNPNSATETPDLTLLNDGSLQLQWDLGTLTTDEFAQPVHISFDTAVPYRFRTKADASAGNGPYAGPMKGAIIHEDAQQSLSYEVTGQYGLTTTSDGTESTPTDDKPVTITAEYFTVSKTATPHTVGIGDTINYTLHHYTSEYYTVTNGLFVDILPDGLTYVNGSASLAPTSVITDTPGKGQTTITWDIPASTTTPGNDAIITFRATVDATYEAPPYSGEPVVSGDSFTNQVTLYGSSEDVITNGRNGTTIPDTSKATVTTHLPTFSKEVQDPLTSQWGQQADGFVGDTLTFRLTYDAAPNIDAREIIIRDFLPRGMSFVTDGDSYTTSGTFSNSGSCTAAPTTLTLGNLNGLQYLEWRLCSTEQGSSWQVTLDALVGPVPDVQPGWLVANFGKLSGQNTVGDTYSRRDLAHVDYRAPRLVLTKSANPRTDLQADDSVTYTISVVNQGDATAYNLNLQDIIPADVLVSNIGGSGTPSASSYTTISGNPASGTGGTIQWSSVASLAAGQTQTFQYTADIPSGLIAGQSMTNLASVAYNSRPDNNGHPIARTTNANDDQTDAETIYIRGLSVQKSATPTSATIGDIVTWEIIGTVPDGVTGFWPVVEENDLPNGFDYITGTTTLDSSSGTVTFDPDHGPHPLDDGNRDLRWFLSPITNTSGSEITFTLSFDTLLTAVNPNNTAQAYYTNNCCHANADNDAYIGWYDTIGGYNNTGSAYDLNVSTNNIDRRSPEADGDVTVQQPYLTLNKWSDYTYMAADGVLVFTLQVRNTGKSTAYEITLEDTLPGVLTFDNTTAVTLSPDNGENTTDNNLNGAQTLTYALDQLPAGSTWTIRYAANIDPDLAAGLVVNNTAQVTSYSSQPGTPADSNGDGLADERTYTGSTDGVTLYAPKGTIFKEQAIDGELTFGNTVVYTLTVPFTPIPAIMHNVQITDVVDSRLQIISVTNGSFDGQELTAVFPTIDLNSQEQIIITAQLPTDNSGQDGDLISNQAQLTYEHDGPSTSNTVAATLVAPALEIDLTTDAFVVAQNDVVTYTAVLHNVGSGLAQNLSLTYNLPANASYLNGSTQLNGQPFTNPVGNSWDLTGHDLSGGDSHSLTFQVRMNSVTQGVSYATQIAATGDDSLGTSIPADNSSRVPADADADDTADVTVYGPLICTSDSTNISYEDLKNTGWSDWDYNDLIMKIDTELCATEGDNVALVSIDYLAIARGAGFTHGFWHDLPLNGDGRYQLTVRDEAGTIIRQEKLAFATLSDIEIFADTKQIFAEPDGGCNSNYNCLSYVNTLAADSIYRDGYSAQLTVLLNDAAQNPSSSLPETPWDPYITVFDTGEEVHRVIPGHLDNTQTVAVTYDPGNAMVGYDLPLVQTFDVTWDWPVEFVGIWRGYPQYVNHVSSGRAAFNDWYSEDNADTQYLWTYGPFGHALAAMWASLSNDTTLSRYFAAPVTADLDGDGNIEIIMGNLLRNQIEVYNHLGQLQWTRNVNGGVKASVAVADFKPGMAGLEILVPSEDGYLYAFGADGTAVSGWPVRVGGNGDTYFRLLSTPALADLDHNGSLEVLVASSNGRLYTFNQNGTLRWQASLGDVIDSFGSQIINSSPTVADLDGDGELEIIVGAYDGAIYAFHADGTLLWRYQTGDIIMSTPTVADVDPNSDGLEIAFGSGDGFVYLLDEAGDSIWQKATGWSVRASALVVDLDNNGDLEILIGSDDDKVWAWHHTGASVSGWPRSTGSDVFATPAFGDIDGDGVNEVIAGSDDGMIYAWEANGTAVANWPYSAGTSVKGRPALINLDNDPEWEVIYGTIDGQMNIIGGTQFVYLPMIMTTP